MKSRILRYEPIAYKTGRDIHVCETNVADDTYYCCKWAGSECDWVAIMNHFGSYQAELGTRQGNVAVVSDTAASGGSIIRFGQGVASCTGTINDPGGPDPWGGCWPGPNNTGVPAGAVLQRVPQDITSGTGWRWVASEDTVRIESCGVTLSNLNIDGEILMRVDNGTQSPTTPCATLRNSIVAGKVVVEGGPLVVEDTEIAVTGSVNFSNVVWGNWWLYRVNVHGGRGPQCMGACGMYDSWSHGLYLEGEVHHNAVGTNGVDEGPFIMQHNFLNCADFSAVDPSTTTGAGCSADIGLYGDFADLKNITIYRNYLAPALVGSGNLPYAQPGYCIQTGMNVSKPFNQPSNLIIRENVIARGATGHCGNFGVHSGWDGPVRGNVWEGNMWDDGSEVHP